MSDTNTIAAQMANVLFNLAQKSGHTLTPDDCILFDKLRKEWDSSRQLSAQSASAVQPVAWAVDDLAQEIRRVDGNHSLGAGALAEALMPFLAHPADADAVDAKRYHAALEVIATSHKFNATALRPSEVHAIAFNALHPTGEE